MSSESEAVAAARDLLWRDVLTWVSSWGAVAHSDDSRTIVVDRTYGHEEVLAFGPKEWAQFVYFGDWFAGPRDHAVYDPGLSGYAVDELFETIGSKGSPLVVRDGRLERE